MDKGDYEQAAKLFDEVGKGDQVVIVRDKKPLQLPS